MFSGGLKTNFANINGTVVSYHQISEHGAKRSIRWSASAEKDILDIWEYIRKDSAESASIVVNAIYQSVSRLESFPLSGRIRGETDIREITLTKYPYVIAYTLDCGDITVIRILHTRRFPRI